MALMLVGVAWVALLTGSIAERFLSPEVRQVEEEIDAVERELHTAERGEAQIAAEISEIRTRLDRIELLLQRPP
jgi:hypothetical protein